MDYILSPCLPSLPSYLKDSSDLIQNLSEFGLVPGSHLVTADVTSLYTNIPIADCITAVDLFCRSNSCTCTALITELTIFVLTNNYFETEGTLFHQRWGLATFSSFCCRDLHSLKIHCYQLKVLISIEDYR